MKNADFNKSFGRGLFLTKAGNVLVEEVVDEEGDPVVEPVPVHQDDFLKKLELGEAATREIYFIYIHE